MKKKKSKAICLSVGNKLTKTEEFRESESEEDELRAPLPVKAAPVEKKVSKKRKASKIIRNTKYV